MRCKGHVRTRSHPEGSIAESYLFDESLTFCSRYLHGETRFNRKKRNDDGLNVDLINTTPFFHKTWLQAHIYVLFNYDHIEPYLK